MIYDKSTHLDYNDKRVTEDEGAKLLRRLLNIVVMESADIEDGYFDKLGEYSSIKKKIMNEVGELSSSEIDIEQCDEIKDLIREIQGINEKNEEALLNLRKKINDELCGLHTRKKTHNAYFSNAIAKELDES